MKILVIDDEEDTRSIASMCLEMLGGATVFQAASGKEGLEKASDELPDVIILDLVMPEMDGMQTLTNLRKNARTENIPVIFLTTKGRFEEFESLKGLGALEVITKPFDPTTLTDQISEILERVPMPKSQPKD
ncbi:MAG TPA: response regulator [Drouetiella sp.]